MYKVGDCLTHINKGILVVDEIRTLNPNDSNSKCYILSRYYEPKTSIISIPVGLSDYLGPIISKKEANKILKDLKNNSLVFSSDNKKRKEEFNQIFLDKDYLKMGLIVKEVYFKRKALSEQKKTIPQFDAWAYNLSLQLLSEQVAFATRNNLDSVKEEIIQIISI